MFLSLEEHLLIFCPSIVFNILIPNSYELSTLTGFSTVIPISIFLTLFSSTKGYLLIRIDKHVFTFWQPLKYLLYVNCSRYLALITSIWLVDILIYLCPESYILSTSSFLLKSDLWPKHIKKTPRFSYTRKLSIWDFVELKLDNIIFVRVVSIYLNKSWRASVTI